MAEAPLLAFLASCAAWSHGSRDWNAEFQLLWATSELSREAAERREGRLRALCGEFDAAVADLAERLVRDRACFGAAAEVRGFLGHFRVGNVLLRVWPEAPHARAFVGGFRAALTTMRRDVCVPLTTLVKVRGATVTAQALVPLANPPVVVYGAAPTKAEGAHVVTTKPPPPPPPHIAAAVRSMAHALGVPHAEDADAALPHVVVAVGLDGRAYFVATRGLMRTVRIGNVEFPVRPELPLISGDTPLLDGPMQRCVEALLRRPRDRAAADSDAEPRDPTGTADVALAVARQEEVVATVHECGLNVAHLGRVLDAMDAASGPENVFAVQRVLIEMACRTMKAAFFLEVLARRISNDDAAMAAALSRVLALLFEEDAARFFSGVVTPLVRKFYISETRRLEISDRLLALRALRRRILVRRFCDLVGAEVAHGRGEGPRAAATVRWTARTASAPHVSRSLLLRRTGAASDVPDAAMPAPVTTRALLCASEGRAAGGIAVLRHHLEGEQHRAGRCKLHLLEVHVTLSVLCCAMHPPLREDALAHAAEARSLLMASSGPGGPMPPTAPKVVAAAWGWTALHIADALLDAGLAHDAAQLLTDAQEVFARAVDSRGHGAIPGLLCLGGLAKCAADANDGSKPPEEEAPVQRLRALVAPTCELAKEASPQALAFELLRHLGTELQVRGDVASAATAFLAAVGAAVKAHGAASEGVINTATDAAFCLFATDKSRHGERCESLLAQATAAARDVYGALSREHAIALNNEGTLRMQLGKPDAALSVLMNADRVFTAVSQPGDAQQRACARNLGVLRSRLRVRAVCVIQRWVRRWRKRRDWRLDAARRRMGELDAAEAHARAGHEADEIEARAALEGVSAAERGEPAAAPGPPPPPSASLGVIDEDSSCSAFAALLNTEVAEGPTGVMVSGCEARSRLELQCAAAMDAERVAQGELMSAECGNRAAIVSEANRSREEAVKREREHLAITGLMPRAAARLLIGAAARGFAARKGLARRAQTPKRDAIAVVAAFVQARLSSTWAGAHELVRHRAAAPIQAALRSRAAVGAVLCMRVRLVFRCLRGFHVRKRLAARATAMCHVKHRRMLRRLLEGEGLGRAACTREEAEQRLQLARAGERLKARLAQHRQQVQRSRDAWMAWRAKLGLLESEEEHRRQRLRDAEISGWARVLRVHRQGVAAARRQQEQQQQQQQQSSEALPPSPPSHRRGSCLPAVAPVPDASHCGSELLPSLTGHAPRRLDRLGRVAGQAERARQPDLVPLVTNGIAASPPPSRAAEGTAPEQPAVAEGAATRPFECPATLGGYAIDAALRAALHWERDLRHARNVLLERRAAMQANAAALADARERALVDLLPERSALVWVPGAPGAPALVYRNSRLVGALGTSHATPPATPSRASSYRTPRLSPWDSTAQSGDADRDRRDALGSSNGLVSAIADEFSLPWQRNAAAQHVADMHAYLHPADRLSPAARRPPQAHAPTTRRRFGALAKQRR